MGQAKDAPDEPCGNGPARASKKSYAKPDNNEFKIDLRRHLNFSPQPRCSDRPQHSATAVRVPVLPRGAIIYPTLCRAERRMNAAARIFGIFNMSGVREVRFRG
jgi:hypothetical protein